MNYVGRLALALVGAPMAIIAIKSAISHKPASALTAPLTLENRLAENERSTDRPPVEVTGEMIRRDYRIAIARTKGIEPYLAVLAKESHPMWLAELERLQPRKYAAYMLAEAAKAAKERETIAAMKSPSRGLRLDFSWRLGGSGTVMLATFKVANTSPINVADIGITCTLYGASGTALARNTIVVHDTVKAGATRTFSGMNLGFTHSQAASATCEIATARHAS